MQLWAFQSNNSTSDFVMELASASAVSGVSVQLASNTWALSQLWQFTSEGCLLPAYNSTLALTGAPDGSVTLQPLSPGNPWQVWKYDHQGVQSTLTNAGSNGLVLLVPGNGGALYLGPAAPNGGSQWVQTTDFADCNYQLTTVTNASPNDLSISLNINQCQGTQSLPGGLTPLPAKTSLTFWTEYSGGPEVGGLASSVQLWDANFSTTNSVASFITHQHHCVLSAGDVWVDTINTAPGSNYQLSTPQTQEGSEGAGLPGLVYMTISYG